MKKLLFFILFLLSYGNSNAQDSFIDSNTLYKVPFRSAADSIYLENNSSIFLLADTLYKAITRKQKEYILSNTPTWEAYQGFLDSTAKAKYSETTFRYKFLYFKTGLNKQFKRIYKEAKKLNINFRRCEPIQYFLEHGIHPDYDREFCYLNLEMKRNKTSKIRIRILLLKMEDNWYFADELSLIVISKKE